MATRSLTVQRVAERLQGSSPQEKRVLRLRCALDGAGSRTLAETAWALATTVDEVRRVEQEALLMLADTGS